METMEKRKVRNVIELRVTTLGEIASFEMGQAPPGADCNMEGRGTVFVKAGEFGELYPEKKEWTTKPLKYGKDGDVFICVVGATTGKLNLGIDCAIGRSVAAIRPNTGFDTRFIYYQLLPSVLQLRASSAGSAQGVLSKKQLSEIPFVVAPLPEQRRIVSAIETQLGRLDVAVARLHAAKVKLKRYKQAVLKAAVEGRLIDPNLSEGELPKGWKVVPVEEVGQIVTGNTPSKSIAAYYGTDHPFYKPTDLAAGYETSESNDGLTEAGLKEARELPAKSILVTCIGATIGKTGLIRVAGACNQQINAIVPNDSLVPEYGYFQCIAPFFQQQIKDNASATTLPLLNKNRFKVLDFILPPKVDQLKIVKAVEERLERTDELETTLDAQLFESTRLRQAVLKRAFEGRLVPAETPVIQMPAPLSVAAEARVLYERMPNRVLTIAERAALNAWVVHVSNKDHHLGRTKAEKIEHLIEGHIGYDHQRAPVRDAAGPIDIQSRKRVEQHMTRLKWGWVEEKQIRGGKIMYKYHSGPHAAEAVDLAESLLGDRLSEATRLVKAMRSLKTSRAEVVATLHAAWNDLLHHSKPTTDRDIMIEATTEWHEDKMEVEHSEWVWGLGWLREHGVIPTGKAKPVKSKTKK